MVFFISVEENEGKIFQKSQNRLLLAVNPDCYTKQCQIGCGACGGNSSVKKVTVASDSAEEYLLGQTVRFRRYILNEAIGALIVFGIPLIMALVTIITWYIISPQKADTPLAVFTTGISFIAGFAVVWLIDNIFRRKFPNVILSSIDKENGDQ
ncbi:MAG TPA: SoxR reducing system RseC family protein [Chitinispirillaceae bacterium]|jgi:hypothetical protein|nr:SoxR reducing system RseC family protein [Chitinispirillaceae bacterium]